MSSEHSADRQPSPPPENPSEVVPSRLAASPGLGHRMVSGMAWVIVQMVGTKVLNMSSQIVLAWLLSKEDFGLVSLAYTVGSILMLLANPGVDTLLIQRSRRMRCWATPVFWMAMSVSLVGAMLLILVGAPLAVWLYAEPRLWGMVAVLAASTLIGTANMVPNVILTSQMRFRQQTIINLSTTLVAVVLGIFLAWWGLGPYSFILPIPLSSLYSLIVQWIWTRPPIRFRPEFRRWRYLVGDSGKLFTYKLLMTLVVQGDRMVLGLFCSTAVVGVYFFGFSYAMQAFAFLWGAFGKVFLPGLNSLCQQPKRQLEVALRSAATIGFLGVPFCMLQAATAAPVIRLVYGQKWDDAVAVVQWISIGSAMDSLTWMVTWLMQARGDFTRLLKYYAISNIFWFLLIIACTWWTRDQLGPAMGIGLFYLVVGPIWSQQVWRSYGATWRQVIALYRIPLLLSAGSILPAWAMFQWIDISRWQGQLLQTGLILAVGGLLYLTLARWFAGALLAECLDRARPLLGRVISSPGIWRLTDRLVRSGKTPA